MNTTPRKRALLLRRPRRGVPGWALLLVVLGAFAIACVMPDASADPTQDNAPARKLGPFIHGLYPLPNNAEVPLEWMPPGSKESPEPSDKIFPPQTLSVRFNHKKHVGEFKLTCKVCHAAAYGSLSASDRLLPKPEQTCDNCHDVSHADPSNVKAGTEDNGQCTFCHLGDAAGRNGKVSKLLMPAPALRFPHKKHLDRNIQCAQCHGRVENIELATREQLPRMAGCFKCHSQSSAGEDVAKGACTTCHLTEPTGQMVTEFASGELMPPQWLHLAQHTPDWIDRHKSVAANDSRFCGNCHKEDYCASCHDGRIRNRTVHPNDWISMHAESARLDNPRCTSCHQEQTFCADCHRRVGVARDAPSGNRNTSERFHPPSSVWSSSPRGPQHHAWEAEQNINACVACHSERDCTTCHATRGVAGGQGVNPHPIGFARSCKNAFSRNPRPCLVCHEGNDASLGSCQ